MATEDEALDQELIREEDQDEYYTLLNVARTASPEEIRSAYRRLCRIYHPDRYQDKEKQEIASLFFKRIQEAYQILSDSRLRAVYDIQGKKGVNDDRALIERTALPTELLEEYEKLKALFEERTYIQEVNPQGLYHLSIDATQLVSGVRNREKASISVTHAYAQQSVSASLSKYASTGLTGSILASHQHLYTGLQCHLRQQLGSHNWFKVTGAIGHFPSIGIDFYRNISDNMYITSDTVIQWTPTGFGASLNTQLARKLDDKSTAVIHVKESGNSVGVSLTRQLHNKVSISSGIMLGYNSSHVQLSLKSKPIDQYIVGITTRLSTDGPSLSYSVDHSVAKLTQVGGRVLVSALSGVELRLRFIRASMNYVIKIQLSPVISLPAVIYATLIPLACYACVKGFAMGPLLHYHKTKETEEMKEEREREMKERKREAESAIELMTETVERIINTEQSRHGLIIVEAWYGHLFSTNQANLDPLAPPKVIDVRIAVQCLVSDSKLVLRESSKSMIPGFYDPCIGDKKYLRVKYRFRGAVHEVTIENKESLVVPRQSHKVHSNEE